MSLDKTENNTNQELERIKDIGLKNLLQKIDKKITNDNIEVQARQTSEEITKKIAPNGKFPPEQMRIPFCPMPTDMCRVSPFFPMARQKLGERQYIRDLIITNSSWGEIKYTGAKLSTYEEDVLMAILAILDSAKNRHITEIEGENTYTYKGPLLPILKLIGYTKYGKTNYNHILAALELMTATCIKLTAYKRTSRGKRKKVMVMGDNIVTHYKWDEEIRELTVTVNPYFYECYVAGSVTLLDAMMRAKIKSPIAKSLYRFMQSHRENIWQGHFLTLSNALNIDNNQPDKEIKRYIKRAVSELIQKELLSSESGFLAADKKEIIKLIRQQTKKQSQKRKETALSK